MDQSIKTFFYFYFLNKRDYFNNSLFSCFASQLQGLGNWAQTFAFHVINKENDLGSSSPHVQCIHGKQQNVCDRRHQKRKVPRDMDPKGEAIEGCSSKGTLNRVKGSSQLCIPESDVKYQMTRVSLENINLFLVETGCACNLEVCMSSGSIVTKYMGNINFCKGTLILRGNLVVVLASCREYVSTL